MKLQKVEIKNFLVLPNVEVNFMKSKVTFLNGLNGRGKTTFQKALRWCLYGPGFDDGHSVLSDLAFTSRAAKSGRAEVKVQMTFELESSEYSTITIERSQWFQATGDENESAITEPELKILGKSGEPGSPTVPLPDPDSWMSEYYPKNLSQFFLFDGEMLEKFFQVQTKQAIGNAVREIAGVEVFDKIKRRAAALEEEWTRARNKAGGASAASLEVDREAKQKLVNHLVGELIKLNEDKNIADLRIEELDGLIGQSEAAQGLLSEDARLAADIPVNEALLNQDLEDFEQMLFDDALEYLPVNAFSEVHKQKERAVANREYPPSFTPTLMEEIVHRGICVCGTVVKEDSEEHNHIERLIHEYEGTNELGLQLQKLVTFAQTRSEALSTFKETVETKNRAITERLNQLDTLKARRAQIDEELAGVNKSQLSTFSEERRALREQLTDVLSSEIRKVDDQLVREQSALSDLTKKIDSANQNQLAKEKYDKKIEAARGVASAAEQAYEEAGQQVRKRLEEVVSRQFSKVKQGEFTTRITEDYEVLTLNSFGKTTNLAAGENMMKAYIFAIALREVVGFTFPLIVDTPFGRLGQVFRQQVTEMILDLANISNIQTIFLMHDGEYEPHTKEAFSVVNPQELYFTYELEEHKSVVKTGIDPDWADGPLWAQWFAKEPK